MIFLDNIGFVALLCLVSQAAMAWLLAAFFRVAASPGRPWVGLLQGAFLAMGVGMSSIAVRFVLSFHEEVYPWMHEGGSFARIAYAIYVGGKFVYLWLLVSALAALRDRRVPRPLTGGIAGAVLGGAVGAASANIDWVMRLQAPVVVVASVFCVRLLWGRRSERTDLGHRVVAVVLALQAVVWSLYFAAEIAIPLQGPGPSWWNLLMRLNSPIDLVLQVVLGIGLVVMMMDGVHQSIVAALRDRDAVLDRMRRAEKMRTLNTLVGGVAHEINNPLTAILGFADDLSLEDAEVRGAAARVVREQAQRCRAIVQRLSILSEAREPRREVVDPKAVVNRVLRGVEPQLRAAGVEVVVAGDLGGARIYVESAALEQVLTNLVVNALHVSARGDRITITLGAAVDRVTFAVEDMGPGVPVADRDRVFEPFFSTKPAGGGTGLGLAVARALVAAHHGTIEVEDGAVGARFVIALPVAGDPTPTPTSTPALAGAQAVELPRGKVGSCVLLVDDEPLVRSTIARHARRAGWSVVEAASVEEALPVLRDPANGIDAVICDLRLPGQSGITLHDRLAEEAPSWLQRMVFVTGDLASEESAAFARRSRAPIFTKPLDFASLLDALRQRLLAERTP